MDGSAPLAAHGGIAPDSAARFRPILTLRARGGDADPILVGFEGIVDTLGPSTTVEEVATELRDIGLRESGSTSREFLHFWDSDGQLAREKSTGYTNTIYTSSLV